MEFDFKRANTNGDLFIFSFRFQDNLAKKKGEKLMKILISWVLLIAITTCNNSITNNNPRSIIGVYKKNYIINYLESVTIDNYTFETKRSSEAFELHIKENTLLYKKIIYDEYGNFSSSKFQPFHYQIDGDHLLIDITKKYHISNDDSFLDLFYVSQDTIFNWHKELEGRYIRINPSDTFVFR